MEEEGVESSTATAAKVTTKAGLTFVLEKEEEKLERRKSACTAEAAAAAATC
jgi:hypothetical protein